MSRVVVGWTPDEYGAAALRHGLAEAALRGYGVVVVNATRGESLVDQRYAGADALAALERELAASGVPAEVRQGVVPDVAGEVLRVAEEVSARLVVLGLRRRTPVGKLLMGSVAQRVILGARCPVLAVKPDTEPV